MIDYPKRGTIVDWGPRLLRLLGGVVARMVPAAVPALLAKLQITADLYPLGLLRTINHVRPMTRFFEAAVARR